MNLQITNTSNGTQNNIYNVLYYTITTSYTITYIILKCVRSVSVYSKVRMNLKHISIIAQASYHHIKGFVFLVMCGNVKTIARTFNFSQINMAMKTLPTLPFYHFIKIRGKKYET